MSPGKHEDCEKCEEHMAWEERLKILDHVPELMTYMNQEKGSKNTMKILLSLFVGIPFTVLLFLITATRTDVAESKASAAKSIELISLNTTQIAQNVAVLTSTLAMHREGNFKEHDALRRDIPSIIANQINVEKNNGKK